MTEAKREQPTDHDAGVAPAKGRILLVDDQVELRRLFERALAKDGHEVVAVGSAREAIALAGQSRFDVVISDVRMPDLTGVELLERLHAEDPTLPVLLVSGAPDLDTAMKAVKYGALEYLVKPLSLDDLRASAARAIEQRRQREQNEQALAQYRSGERSRARAGAGGDRESWTGELLGGCFRVGRLLGAGGMGAVYEATREDLGQMRVAIKILHATLASDETLLSRFRREAQTIGAINHPNIVSIFDFQAQAGEPAFLVMELLDGVSLRHELTRQGQFSSGRTVFIAAQMLAALAAVHRAHVIHRDVKPENIMLTTISGLADIVKVLDFGVAKPLNAVPGDTLTHAGTVLGTPTYMAPEHARGAPIDIRSDLYSVGAIMYEALAGHAPYSGDNYNALLFAIQQGKPVPLDQLRSDVEPALIDVVMRAMATDANLRFQTAEEMLEALAPWSSQATSSAPPESSAAVYAPTMVPPSKT